MLSTAICEDCPHQTNIILALLNAYNAGEPDIEIQPHSFYSGKELLGALDSGAVFGLYLLDIMMPGLNGIKLARELRSRGEDAPIVFMTSSADYALDAFNVSAIQYILKPVKGDELYPVLDKIISGLNREPERYFVISTPRRSVKAPYSSIICVESIQRTLRVYLEDRSALYSKTIREPFATLTAPLLEDNRFICVHKSFVLNMDWVEELTGNSFIMKNDIRMPIPRYRYTYAKTKYLDYLSERGVGIAGGV